ncbi:unnamed protein product, partial [Meganyctiphanes norvegica]
GFIRRWASIVRGGYTYQDKTVQLLQTSTMATTVVNVNQAPAPVYMNPVPVVYNAGIAPLAPGVCTVCRKGKIVSSRTWCTWITCCLLLPFGCIPGIIAFCCCCKKPTCTHCGYQV